MGDYRDIMTEFDMEPGLSFAMKDVIGDTHEK
jgi:hypothetical protein